MIEYIGYMGAVLLAFCALPQAIMSIMQGHSRGMSYVFLWMWLTGEIYLMWFVVATVGVKGPLFFNYFCNTVLVSIITWYRYFPREDRG